MDVPTMPLPQFEIADLGGPRSRPVAQGAALAASGPHRVAPRPACQRQRPAFAPAGSRPAGSAEPGRARRRPGAGPAPRRPQLAPYFAACGTEDELVGLAARHFVRALVVAVIGMAQQRAVARGLEARRQHFLFTRSSSMRCSFWCRALPEPFSAAWSIDDVDSTRLQRGQRGLVDGAMSSLGRLRMSW